MSSSPIRPALFHQCIHSLWTCWWTLHAFLVCNEAYHIWSFHFLHKVKQDELQRDFQFSSNCSVNSAIKVICDLDSVQQKHLVQYLVRFPSIGESLPHGDTKTPHITFTGEFVVVYTFWCVPFQRPFTCSTGLYNTNNETILVLIV